jgi:hypothetical protein
MDLDSILNHLQTWTNNVPVIILGSGASIPFNLPSMWNLGEHLKHSIKLKDKHDLDQFKEFLDCLDKLGDLETALGELRIRPKFLDEIIIKTWELVNKCDLEAYDMLIEGLEFPLAELTSYLVYPTDRKLSIITTNYDRLAEYASSMAGAFICNGFAPNYLSRFTNQIHLNNIKGLKGFNGQVNIWKVHGSLDWFKTEDETNLQLPLRHVIPKRFKPCIVTPGLTKYFETHIEPFRTILAQADSDIENANGFLCIGYGFNDIHVHPKLMTQIKNHKPIIVITKELTTKTKSAIIGSKCNAYILLEQANINDTRIYSSFLSKPEIIPGVSYWTLSEYLKLIKS